ncbi:MAG: hypothetical protein AB7I37_19565 [Pirellulales bacterium]
MLGQLKFRTGRVITLTDKFVWECETDQPIADFLNGAFTRKEYGGPAWGQTGAAAVHAAGTALRADEIIVPEIPTDGDEVLVY